MAAPKLHLDAVSKVYPNGIPALAPTTLSIAPGEFVILVGPSGCGKSTLLRIVAGLESATSGTVTLDGRIVNGVPPKDRDIAMVFQGYALYPHMTVRDNIGFGLRMRRVPHDERDAQVLSAARTLGLSELLDRRPAELSGGQRQRVALARAIVRRPSLFLFDEPLSNLDAALRATTRVELLRLHRSLTATSLYVTHDQVEAMSMGDRLVVLRDGVVQQVGTPLDVYRRPANLFVATFLGSPPMNLLPARLDATGTCIELSTRRLALSHALPAAANQPILLGLRPEHLHPTDQPHAAFTGTVELVEPLGNETLLTCRCDGHDLTVRTIPDTPYRPLDRIHLTPDLSLSTLFHPSGPALVP